ncbi:MAG: transcriptional regulator, partial [Chloroflexota bacterium]|nr:transcriptional regulator [Chloroflexota bacterium]
RNRILHILADRPATNQQLAAALGDSQAKVLHHVRFLLDVELIRLVEQRVTGGNVEKYYRASARLYGFRPEPSGMETLSGAVFEAVTQEVVASLSLWPEQDIGWEGRGARLSTERLKEFDSRLLALLAEYWGGPDTPAPDDPDGELMAFATVTYRFPGDA